MSKIDKTKERLLHFISSQLASHASSLIGFSVMLFAYLNIISQFYPNRIPFTFCFCFATSTFRYLVIFLILWAINTLIIYTLFRLAFYGRLALETFNYEGTASSLKELYNDTVDKVKKRSRALKWYSKGISAFAEGLWFSLILGFFVSIILIWTFLFY